MTSIYDQIPGGSDLIAWFDDTELSFHDGEIIRLDLCRTGESRLSIHWWRLRNNGSNLTFEDLESHAIVTFVLSDVLDVQLSDFSQQNVVGELTLSRSRVNEEAQYFPRQEPEMCWKIEIVPCYGLHGSIKAQGIRVELSEGIPPDSVHFSGR